jgi:outer membrane protein OmpA-like peptidoglycan-associated protein
MAVYILLTCSVIVAAEGGGLTITERDQIAIVAQSAPSIDLEVPFDYRSAGITRGARQQLENLGMALISPELNGITVLIAGHTSPEGPERYNVMLAQRRAEVIKRFLVENFDIPPEHLVGREEPDFRRI